MNQWPSLQLTCRTVSHSQKWVEQDDVGKGETAEANLKTFKSHQQEFKDLITIAKYSVIVTECKNGAGSCRKRFQKQDEANNSIQTKTEVRKAFHLIDVANYVITAYCRLGNKTCGNHTFQSLVLGYSALFVKLLSFS